jgi:hypothetical protein
MPIKRKTGWSPKDGIDVSEKKSLDHSLTIIANELHRLLRDTAEAEGTFPCKANIFRNRVGKAVINGVK